MYNPKDNLKKWRLNFVQSCELEQSSIGEENEIYRPVKTKRRARNSKLDNLLMLDIPPTYREVENSQEALEMRKLRSMYCPEEDPVLTEMWRSGVCDADVDSGLKSVSTISPLTSGKSLSTGFRRSTTINQSRRRRTQKTEEESEALYEARSSKKRVSGDVLKIQQSEQSMVTSRYDLILNRIRDTETVNIQTATKFIDIDSYVYT